MWKSSENWIKIIFQHFQYLYFSWKKVEKTVFSHFFWQFLHNNLKIFEKFWKCEYSTWKSSKNPIKEIFFDFLRIHFFIGKNSFYITKIEFFSGSFSLVLQVFNTWYDLLQRPTVASLTGLLGRSPQGLRRSIVYWFYWTPMPLRALRCPQGNQHSIILS